MTISTVRLNDNCTICLSRLNEPANGEGTDRALLITRCNHLFHATCLNRQIQVGRDYSAGPRCPNCRRGIGRNSDVAPAQAEGVEETQELHTETNTNTTTTSATSSEEPEVEDTDAIVTETPEEQEVEDTDTIITETPEEQEVEDTDNDTRTYHDDDTDYSEDYSYQFYARRDTQRTHYSREL